ncbi:MAG: PAS domain S-box protein, partial [Nitrosomonadales bacterium]|nr:PAS domain S-box protein [Nitrosomonadales bacterium]
MPDRGGYRSGYTFVLIFALMAIGIVLTGYTYYLNYERNFRTKVESELSGIAELKVGELALWRRERLGDGAVLFKNITFSALVRRFLEKPGDADAQRQLQAWMLKYTTAYGYTLVHLVDTQGRMRISVPRMPGSYVSSAAMNVTDILRAGQVGIEDFHRNTPDGPVHLAVVVPIFDDLDDRRPLGVLSLHIDPGIYLYHFIATWPTSSQTAETLLVRREGDDALFLNELRFQKNTPLNLRIPLTKTEVPAVRAALGQTGIFEGVDYRGAPVVAAIRAVPDSPWFLLARMNTSEVYAPVRERLWQMVAFAVFLFFGSAVAMSFIWRQRSAHYRERDKAEEKLAAAYKELKSIIEAQPDILYVINTEGDLIKWNSALEKLCGLSPETMMKRPAVEFVCEEDRPTVYNGIKEVFEKGSAFIDVRFIRGDGALVPHLCSGAVWKNPGGEVLGFIGVGRDITERKEYEEELKRSNVDLEQFSYAVSHDMRQPLRMISSYLQLIELKLADQLDGEKRDYFNFAVEGAKRIDRMLVELLEYSRVGRMGEPPTWIDSRAALDEALQFLQPAIAEAQAKVSIAGEWPSILACHDEILGLLQNLIGNAAKFR